MANSNHELKMFAELRVQDMHNYLLDRFLSTLVFFSAVLLLCIPAWSADWEVSPYVTIIEEYDDNIDFSVDEKKCDWVTYVKPRVEGIYRTERFSLSFDSGIEVEKYVDYDEFDTINHDHKLALSYGLSRTLGLRAGGYFREDTTLETELIEEGLLVDREDRRKFGGNLGFDYAFSKRLFFSGGWTRRYTEYPDDPDDFDDRQSDTFDLVAPRYVFSPKTSLFLKMVHTKTEYDEEGDPSITNYSISPSFRHDFAEDFYISGGAGYRYTKDKTASRDEHDDGFVFDLSFHRDWKKISMELLASRDQYSTVDKSSVERERLTLKGTYRLSTRFRTSVAATFRRNRVDEGGDDHDYFTVTPALSYDLTPTISLRGSVDYSEYDYKDDSDRERFRARLVLNFKWPRLWSGK